MSRRDMWAYNPGVCDGDFCPMNCDHCPKTDDAVEMSALSACDPEGPIDLEMGFDPYAGDYTWDC